MFVKQFRSEDGSTSIEEFAIIEVKAPGYVRGLFHDIGEFTLLPFNAR